MKKLTLLSVASLISLASFAEGYQVNLLSAKQAGMGHVGTAMKLGSESIHFNPAGLGFMEGKMDYSAGISGIISEATFTNGDYKATTDNSLSTPMYLYAGFRVTDKIKAGFSVTTPYGSGINWGKDWAGAELVQDISLKAFYFQPTISYKITDKLSVGAGLMLAKGSVELSRAMASKESLTAFLTNSGLGGLAPGVTGNYPVSANLYGKSNIGVGFNVGIMWDLHEKVTFGASYRSKVQMKVKEGDASFAFEGLSDPLLGALGTLLPSELGFSAEMPMPANLSAGLTFRPTNRWTVSGDLQLVGWSKYQELVVNFTESVLGKEDIQSTKSYRNAMAARIGAQYNINSKFDVRAGLYIDQTPVHGDHYNPETPGMNKLGTSVGMSYRPKSWISIDLSALYIKGLGRDGSISYNDLLTGTEKQFKGHYTTKAFAPTIGVSLVF